jgi:hypothetical protein
LNVVKKNCEKDTNLFHEFIDKLRRSFLWAGAAECREGHCLVAWPTVCQPKSIGGLGRTLVAGR